MTDAEIKKIYKKYKTPNSIIDHMETVAKVCGILADAANANGLKVNKEILIKAAKLHDAVRPCDFRDFNEDELKHKHTTKDIEVWKGLRDQYGKIGHAKAMANILTKMGEHEVAHLVEVHDFNQIDNLKTLEEKIIYYADKRVDKDQIVTLDYRMSEGKKRNFREGDDEKNRQLIIKKIKKLEQELIKYAAAII